MNPNETIRVIDQLNEFARDNYRYMKTTEIEWMRGYFEGCASSYLFSAHAIAVRAGLAEWAIKKGEATGPTP